MMNSVEKIVSQIVELSLDINSGDQTRDIYSILLSVSLETGRIMSQNLEQERVNEFTSGKLPKIS